MFLLSVYRFSMQASHRQEWYINKHGLILNQLIANYSIFVVYSAWRRFEWNDSIADWGVNNHLFVWWIHKSHAEQMDVCLNRRVNDDTCTFVHLLGNNTEIIAGGKYNFLINFHSLDCILKVAISRLYLCELIICCLSFLIWISCSRMRENQADHQSPVRVRMTAGTDRGQTRVNSMCWTQMYDKYTSHHQHLVYTWVNSYEIMCKLITRLCDDWNDFLDNWLSH